MYFSNDDFDSIFEYYDALIYDTFGDSNSVD